MCNYSQNREQDITILNIMFVFFFSHDYNIKLSIVSETAYLCSPGIDSLSSPSTFPEKESIST